MLLHGGASLSVDAGEISSFTARPDRIKFRLGLYAMHVNAQYIINRPRA